jgi:hypothetical protein
MILHCGLNALIPVLGDSVVTVSVQRRLFDSTEVQGIYPVYGEIMQ